MSKVSPLFSKAVNGIAIVGLVACLVVVIHSLATGQGLQLMELAIALLLTVMLLHGRFRKE